MQVAARVAEIPVDDKHLVAQTLIADHLQQARAHFFESRERVGPHAERARDVLALRVPLGADEDARPIEQQAVHAHALRGAAHLQREVVEHGPALRRTAQRTMRWIGYAFAAWSNAWIARVCTMASLTS